MATNSLKQQAISGVFWSAIQQFGTSIISFLSNIVLARLLSPDDYGCIGLLTIFIAISNVFIFGGFVSALIQKKDAANIDYTTAFYWNIIISIIFYAILFFSAPLIASFYHIALLKDILRVLGLLLIISGFSVVQNTILRKTFQFNKLARIDIIAAIISVIFSITLALIGFGIWSLVAQQLIARTCRVFLLWQSSNWRPQLAFSIKSFREMFSYGSFLLLSDLLNCIVDNIQGLLIGRRYSASQMGFYSQAKKLEEIPTTSISYLVNNVTFPIYSKIQDNPGKLKKAVKESISMMNFINFPLMLMLVAIAKSLLITLYSDKWIESVPYFQILCLGGLVNCIQSVNYQVVAAVGRSKELFNWNIVKRSVGIVLIIIGTNFGVKGILWGMVIGMYFTSIVNSCLAGKSTGYGLIDQIKDSLPLLMISVISSVFSYLPTLWDFPFCLLLVLQVIVFMITYLLLSKAFKRQELDECRLIINNYLGKGKNK